MIVKFNFYCKRATLVDRHTQAASRATAAALLEEKKNCCDERRPPLPPPTNRTIECLVRRVMRRSSSKLFDMQTDTCGRNAAPRLELPPPPLPRRSREKAAAPTTIDKNQKIRGREKKRRAENAHAKRAAIGRVYHKREQAAAAATAARRRPPR